MSSKTNIQKPVKVGMISLGCAKNLVDAEIMLGTLIRDGVEITNDATKADVVVINSCSFIDAAQEESVDTILESAELREAHHRGQALIVSGCMPQRFREELPKLMPEIDAFMGIDQVANVTSIVRQAMDHRQARLTTAEAPRSPGKKKVLNRITELQKSGAKHATESADKLSGTGKANQTKQVVQPAAQSDAPVLDVHNRPNYIPDYATPRFRLTPRHFAYLKIAEGCNHPCSFCIIPRMRGSHRSRTQSDVVAESKALLADGVKEINLISQDSTYYGLDLRTDRKGSISAPEKFTAATRALPQNATTLSTLLKELNGLKGEFWIRLLYTHPAHWTDELLDAIAASAKVARYIDMPLQHIHDNMLERMRRETSSQYIIDLIAKIRARIPGIAIRTTFIIGFPGETEAYFKHLVEFVRATRFERLGVFSYSKEEGTRAGAMAGQVTEATKRKRKALIMAEQLKISRSIAAEKVGTTLKVLIEKPATTAELKGAQVSSWEHGLIREQNSSSNELHGRFHVARGEADAPDIDGRIYVKGKVPVGEFCEVRVIGHTDYDLIAEPVKK